MSPETFRATALELARTQDLLGLVDRAGAASTRSWQALDVGARDGHFSRLLAAQSMQVVALDLQRPAFKHPGVATVQGDVTALEFANRRFDFVLCVEVLEHIPPASLVQACQELQRVCSGHLLIGVPDRQDLRVGRTRCAQCGQANPPWGHVNRFDEHRLRALFPDFEVKAVSGVGRSHETTNDLSTWLMDLAGNPYGTYVQDEPCVHCGGAIGTPAPRTLVQKLLTKAAFWTRWPSQALSRPHANWIHLLLERRAAHG